MTLDARLLKAALSVYALMLAFFARRPPKDMTTRRSDLALALRLSTALGLILTFVLTILVVSTMSMLGGHHIGTPSGASVLLLGWSRDVGDLRAPHFLDTHALHILPLAGLPVSFAQREKPGHRRQLVR
ncbi:MAG: hypothetical protein ACQETX_05730 [Pseudomonadota bacterium]